MNLILENHKMKDNIHKIISLNKLVFQKIALIIANLFLSFYNMVRILAWKRGLN